MPKRIPPYPPYNYLVHLHTPGSPPRALGGFSKLAWFISGAATSASKAGGIHQAGSITLKRGIVDSLNMWDWIFAANTVNARREVAIILQDVSHSAASGYKLHNTTLTRYTGLQLGDEEFSELLIEELVIAHEGIEIIPLQKH
jgi:phage tail-like protein